MSSIYQEIRDDRYYQMTYAADSLMTDKTLTLGERAGATFLHKFLYGIFQHKTDVRVKLTAKEIHEGTLIDEKKLKRCRDILIERKLILAERGDGFYTYIACHSKTGKPLPKPERAHGAYDFDTATKSQLYNFFSSRLGTHFKVRGTQIQARCPSSSHADTHYSFAASIQEGSGGPWKCNGCGRKGKLVEFEKLVSSSIISTQAAHRRVRMHLSGLGLKRNVERVGLRPDDRVFYYEVDYGEVAFEKVKPVGKTRKPWFRRQDPDDPEKFLNNIRDQKRILYHLPEVQDAFTVIVTEGESDCDAVRALELLDFSDAKIAVTCNMFGAHGWSPEEAVFLKDKYVLVIGDNDRAGDAYVRSVRSSLIGLALDVRGVKIPEQVPESPVKVKDVRNFLEAKGAEGKQAFLKLLPIDWLSDEHQVEKAHCAEAS